jgi:serine phosphatase RsbU (regulator of sigma subunit)
LALWELFREYPLGIVCMGQSRTTVRIAVLGVAPEGAAAATWRARIESEIAGTSVSLLDLTPILDTGLAHQLDAEIVILVAGSDPAVAARALDRAMHAVEALANDAHSIASARVVSVSDAIPACGGSGRTATFDAFTVERAERELIAFLRGVVTCASSLREARRELALLGRVVDSMRGELEERNEELQLAALVQRDFLPLPVPPLHGVRVASFYRPLAGVSGDVYHLEQLDEDRIAIFLADAVGHGIPAALLGMAVCRSLETVDRTHGIPRWLGPAETISRANRRLVDSQRATTRFATAIAGVLDCRTRRLRLATAGHPAAILLRPGEAPRPIECEGGLLGIFPDEPYEEIELELQPNDRILFYSDGFEQAFSENGCARHVEEFGTLSGILDADQFIEEISSRVDAQSGSLHQADDLTLLCVSIGAAVDAHADAHADARVETRRAA